MSHSKAHLPLAFGVGFWSNDLSELSNQLEIAEVLREKNIKILDTARHYVCIVLTLFNIPVC